MPQTGRRGPVSLIILPLMKVLTIILIMTSLITEAQEVKYLALGDSYTIGESVEPKERWPSILTQRLREAQIKVTDPLIIATTGWRTDDLKNAIHKSEVKPPYQLVSLLIGVNNQYQGRTAESYAPEFEELLRMAIEFAGGERSKVFVVSIPDYGFTPFGKEKQNQITTAIDQFNAVNQRITERYGVRYFNITPLTRLGFERPELVASDGLHPSGLMYQQWVDEVILPGMKVR